jgi:Holliday junction resolvase RusA-like endonuclease
MELKETYETEWKDRFKTLDIFIPGQPDPGSLLWRWHIKDSVKNVMKEKHIQMLEECAVCMDLQFRLERPKYHFDKDKKLNEKYLLTPHIDTPDIQWLSSTILDCLENMVYKSISQVQEVCAYKCYDTMPGLCLSVYRDPRV